jgi:hypothetical protein
MLWPWRWPPPCRGRDLGAVPGRCDTCQRKRAKGEDGGKTGWPNGPAVQAGSSIGHGPSRTPRASSVGETASPSTGIPSGRQNDPADLQEPRPLGIDTEMVRPQAPFTMVCPLCGHDDGVVREAVAPGVWRYTALEGDHTAIPWFGNGTPPVPSYRSGVGSPPNSVSTTTSRCVSPLGIRSSSTE